MKVEICVIGGNVFGVLDRTSGFPKSLEQTLKHTFERFTSPNIPQKPILRFTPMEDGYLFSVISANIEERINYYFRNYYMDREMADTLLGTSWEGLVERVDRLGQWDIAQQREILLTRGWSDFGGNLFGSQRDSVPGKVLLFGAYICAFPDARTKLRLTAPMEQTINELLRILPPALRRNLSFCGPVTCAGQAFGSKLYFAQEADARRMDSEENAGGEIVNLLYYEGGDFKLPGRMLRENELWNKLSVLDVSDEVWDMLCQCFPEEGTWEDMFRLSKYFANLPDNFENLIGVCGTEKVTQLVQSNFLTDEELKAIFKKNHRWIRQDSLLSEAIETRLPPVEAPSTQPIVETPHLSEMTWETEIKLDRAKRIRNKKNTSARKLIVQLLASLVDLVLIAMGVILILKTALEPVAVTAEPVAPEMTTKYVIFTMETVNYLQHTLVVGVLAFLCGILVMRLIRNLLK